jgi:hypothetical protein
MLLNTSETVAGGTNVHQGEIVQPSPALLIDSLRSIGYTPETAVADIIDNSITAGASHISLIFSWQGPDSLLTITDDGRGMHLEVLIEALRLGSRPAEGQRRADDLGRFGLGLKTATFSQCRCLTVLTKVAGGLPICRSWDLDHVAASGQWQLLCPSPSEGLETKLHSLKSGTAIQWSMMDRFVSSDDTAGEEHFWALAKRISQHLSLTFHRYLDASETSPPLAISVNDRPLKGFNPFLTNNLQTARYSPERPPDGSLVVRPFILPPPDTLPNKVRDEAAGPLGWEAHQGFFIYRNKRLLVPGSWLNLAKVTPAHNRVRIQLDLTTAADTSWQVDVLKSKASAPRPVREFLSHIASRVCALATQNHRAAQGPRQAEAAGGFEPLWLEQDDRPLRPYILNRAHPVMTQLLTHEDTQKVRPLLEVILRLIEDSVPLGGWLTGHQQPTPESPRATEQEQEILAELRSLVRLMTNAGRTAEDIKQALLRAEPYNQYPNLIALL